MMVDQPRPATPLQLTLPGFEGGVHELLSLASDRRIDLEEIAVRTVAAQVAEYVGSVESLDLDAAGDLIASVARLTALKSSRILLQPSTEEGMPDAGQRPAPLIDLQTLAAGISALRQREGQEATAPATPPVVFERRSAPRRVDILRRAITDMQSRNTQAGHHVSVPSFVRIEVAVSGLLRRLRSSASLSFRRIIGTANRHDAVVHFLALLEVLRSKQAVAVQNTAFGDITLRVADRTTAGDASERAG